MSVPTLVTAEPKAGAKRPSFWLLLLPGGGQFALGQTAAGIGYLTGTAGLAGWGVWAESKRTSGAINAPLVYAQQVYVASMYAAHRDLNEMLGDDRHAASGRRRTDPSSMSTLARAPFRLKNLVNPWVVGFAALGVGANWAAAASQRGRRGFARVSTVRYLGGTFNRDQGLAVYTAYWVPLSYGAGEAEEMLFRGMLQASWEERWGATFGLLAASTVFGLAHVTKLREAESWHQAGWAALAGVYLGWRYQRTGYRLSEPIAAHVWFDIAAGFTLFLLDPVENPLGAKIKFAF